MVYIKDNGTKSICDECKFEAQNTTFRKCPKCGSTPMRVVSNYKEECFRLKRFISKLKFWRIQQ